MAELKAESKRLGEAKRAKSTRRNYDDDWRGFSNWCAENGREPLPASPETIELFVTHELKRGLISTTVRRRLIAISVRHKDANLPTPVQHGAWVRISSWRKEHKEQSFAKTAITPEDLRKMARVLGTSKKDVRDRAILVLGFFSAMRRSELSALNLADVYFGKLGIEVAIHKSKRDQEQKGRRVSIFNGKKPGTCPVRALKSWVKVRGKWDGPLFTQMSPGVGHEPTRERLGGETVAEIVQTCAARIGLDPGKYGAHSLRAGLVTAALNSGVGAFSIMETTGHKSLQTLQPYHRPKPFAVNVLAKVAL